MAKQTLSAEDLGRLPRLTAGDKWVVPGAAIAAIVSHVDGPHKLFIQLASESDVINKLSNGLAAHYGADSYVAAPVVNVKRGSLCAAKYEIDGRWYRGCVVARPAPRKVTVQYIDYGNTQEVEEAVLQALDARFEGFPPQAIEVMLHKTSESTIPTGRLRALVEGKRVQARIEQMLSSGSARAAVSMLVDGGDTGAPLDLNKVVNTFTDAARAVVLEPRRTVAAVVEEADGVEQRLQQRLQVNYWSEAVQRMAKEQFQIVTLPTAKQPHHFARTFTARLKQASSPPSDADLRCDVDRPSLERLSAGEPSDGDADGLDGGQVVFSLPTESDSSPTIVAETSDDAQTVIAGLGEEEEQTVAVAVAVEVTLSQSSTKTRGGRKSQRRSKRDGGVDGPRACVRAASIAVGSRVRVQLMQVRSVDDFWCSLAFGVAFGRLMDEMHFAAKRPLRAPAVVGDHCMATRDGRDFWRARVLSVDKEATLLALDYGRVDSGVPLASLYELEPKMTELPAQAIHCRLDGDELLGLSIGRAQGVLRAFSKCEYCDDEPLFAGVTAGPTADEPFAVRLQTARGIDINLQLQALLSA